MQRLIADYQIVARLSRGVGDALPPLGADREHAQRQPSPLAEPAVPAPVGEGWMRAGTRQRQRTRRFPAAERDGVTRVDHAVIEGDAEHAALRVFATDEWGAASGQRDV